MGRYYVREVYDADEPELPSREAARNLAADWRKEGVNVRSGEVLSRSEREARDAVFAALENFVDVWERGGDTIARSAALLVHEFRAYRAAKEKKS